MKILKKPDSEDPIMIAKKKALEGCDVCPFCKENKKLYSAADGNKGVAWIDFDYIYKLFKIYKTEVFKCYTCGAEWESDPYFLKYKF